MRESVIMPQKTLDVAKSPTPPNREPESSVATELEDAVVAEPVTADVAGHAWGRNEEGPRTARKVGLGERGTSTGTVLATWRSGQPPSVSVRDKAPG